MKLVSDLSDDALEATTEEVRKQAMQLELEYKAKTLLLENLEMRNAVRRKAREERATS